jgi:phosphoglycolate phosphatase
MQSSILNVLDLDFVPRLVIFDKDGTLIDFHHMWGEWAVRLGRRLDSSSGHSISPRLFLSFAFDPVECRVSPDGPLALWPMTALRQLTVDLVVDAGLGRAEAERAVSQAWYVPDPVQLARPLADLHGIFERLASDGIKIGVATTDDRAAAEATLEALQVAQYVNMVVGGDEGLPSKPAPDMVLELCRRLDVAPAQTMVVGDAVADLEMGRAAGVGQVVGVLSGVSSREILAPYADTLVGSVADLL